MFVYIVRNVVNNKVYVGKTQGSIENRWQEHVRKAKRGGKLAFYNAIRKYGEAMFQVSRLSAAVSSEQLDTLERFFIAKHRSYPPELGYGYNLTPGGEGGPTRLGKTQTAEAKRKLSEYRKNHPIIAGSEWAKSISAALKGRVFTPEWAAKIGDAQRGSKNSMFGKPNSANLGRKLSPEWRANLSIAQKAAWVKRRQNSV